MRWPRLRLADLVAEADKRAAAGPVAPVLSSDEIVLGRYLSTSPELLAALSRVIRARIEGRGVAPIPSTPEQAHVDRARDYECRSIVAQLEALAEAPPPSPFQSGAVEQ